MTRGGDLLTAKVQAPGLLRTPYPYPYPFSQALTFGAATSDRVDCGNPSNLTDVNTGTCCAWVYNTATATNQRIWAKGAGVNIHHFRLTTSQFGIVIGRATAPLNVQASASNFAAYATGKWLFVVGLWDTGGANGDQKILIGDLANPPVPPSSYDIAQTVGSGTVNSDAAGNFLIGNAGTNVVSWVGRIAAFGFWNRQLSYAEILDQYEQMNPTAGCVLLPHLGYNGVGRQQDWSGYNNHGTVTGATYTPFGIPVPTAPAWHRRAFVHVTGNPWYYYRGQAVA